VISSTRAWGAAITVACRSALDRLGRPVDAGNDTCELIGGPLEGARNAVEIYRAAGERAGHPEKLKLGISTHYAGEDVEEARRVYLSTPTTTSTCVRRRRVAAASSSARMGSELVLRPIRRS
jgi:hypothetical protein